MTNMIGLVLADDHRVFAEGLGVMLDAQDDLAVLGVAHDSHQAIEVAARHEPTVLLLDAHMPGPDLATTLRAVRASSPGTKVLMLSPTPAARRSPRRWRPGPTASWPRTPPAGRSRGPSARWSTARAASSPPPSRSPGRPATPASTCGCAPCPGASARSSACWPTAGPTGDRRGVLPLARHRPHPCAERPGQAGVHSKLEAVGSPSSTRSWPPASSAPPGRARPDHRPVTRVSTPRVTAHP